MNKTRLRQLDFAAYYASTPRCPLPPIDRPVLEVSNNDKPTTKAILSLVSCRWPTGNFGSPETSDRPFSSEFHSRFKRAEIRYRSSVIRSELKASFAIFFFIFCPPPPLEKKSGVAPRRERHSQITLTSGLLAKFQPYPSPDG